MKSVKVTSPPWKISLKVRIYDDELISCVDAARILGFPPKHGSNVLFQRKQFKDFVVLDGNIAKEYRIRGKPISNFVKLSDMPAMMHLLGFSEAEVKKAMLDFAPEEVVIPLSKDEDESSVPPFRKRRLPEMAKEGEEKKLKAAEQILQDVAAAYPDQVKRVILQRLAQKDIADLISLI